MGFLGWFRKNKKEEDIKLSRRRENTLQDAAVAAAFAEAGEYDTASSMIDTSKGRNTVLIIGRGDAFSERLADYAVEMAGRLEFKLLAVNITSAPLSLPAGEREEAIAEFEKGCTANCTSLKEKAAGAEIPLVHQVEIGVQDEVVEKLHKQYPGMRYVLTEPDPEAAGKAEGKVSIPVFDLGSFQGAAA